MFFEPLARSYLDGVEKQSPLPLIDHGAPEEMGAYVPMIFPNIGIAASENSWSTFHVNPIAADKTVVETRTRVMPASN